MKRLRELVAFIRYAATPAPKPKDIDWNHVMREIAATEKARIEREGRRAS